MRVEHDQFILSKVITKSCSLSWSRMDLNYGSITYLNQVTSVGQVRNESVSLRRAEHSAWYVVNSQ